MKKPRLSFWQIWNMSFGFLGIQFGFGLQNANVSRIFQTLGAEMDAIPVLWIAAPITGLIIQPIIGHFSDKTWTRLGRRRPYFLVGAIMASIALIFMPNAPALWVAAGMLWIMDASINISMEPFRAFVGDLLPDEQRTAGFAMQSFFIGTGAVVASALPYLLTNILGIENTAPEGQIPPSVKYAFYIGAAVFFLTVLWTVISTKEYSPEEVEQFETAAAEKRKLQNYTDEIVDAKRFLNTAVIFSTFGIVIAALVYSLKLEKEIYILAGILVLFSILMLISWYLRKNKNSTSGLVEIFSDLLKMPKTMKQLAVVQFFTWLALFAMWIYTTAAVTDHIYGTKDPTSELFNKGANWVGVLFAVYNGAAAVFAFLLPILAKYTSRKITHTICLIIGGISLASLFLFKDPQLLILPMLGVGLAWASILSMPYAILTGSLPEHKMGIYMGIFNFFIVLPQILAATILGAMTKHLFNQHAIYTLIFGGAMMIIAGIMTFFVSDISEKLIRQKNIN
ncbi:MAG TPA: MFS transporter [Bacteroidales bacterium]|nr:MFS transporter [Bacteroidales bacterium]HOL97121.1 MFS transporter [Bacteroidales bacterium]HOM35414.1 MFS transporter [Bacteroidales bacterium]HPD23095.1 MFS transporter [Bacteroidales bacterium]HRS99383.1 MFS transporter [Bacteroidales bacterium]